MLSKRRARYAKNDAVMVDLEKKQPSAHMCSYRKLRITLILSRMTGGALATPGATSWFVSKSP